MWLEHNSQNIIFIIEMPFGRANLSMFIRSARMNESAWMSRSAWRGSQGKNVVDLFERFVAVAIIMVFIIITFCIKGGCSHMRSSAAAAISVVVAAMVATAVAFEKLRRMPHLATLSTFLEF